MRRTACVLPRKLIRIIWLLPATAVLFAAPAQAEEWEGPVAGITVSQNWVEGLSTARSDVPSFAPFEVVNGRDDGPSIGGLIGYRTNFGNFVFGAEIDADLSDAKITRTTPDPRLSIRTRWQGSLRAVAGAPIGRALLFVTGGLGTARTAHGIDFNSNVADVIPPIRWSRTPVGWVAGGGIELALGGIHPRIEYRHADYGTTETAIAGRNDVFIRRLSSDSIRLTAVIPF